MCDKKFLDEQPRETLITIIMNAQMREDMLRDRLYLLSGCRCFGEADGTNGVCVECSYNNPELHERCLLFHMSAHQYINQKYSKMRKECLERKEPEKF